MKKLLYILVILVSFESTFAQVENMSNAEKEREQIKAIANYLVRRKRLEANDSIRSIVNLGRGADGSNSYLAQTLTSTLACSQMEFKVSSQNGADGKVEQNIVELTKDKKQDCK